MCFFISKNSSFAENCAFLYHKNENNASIVCMKFWVMWTVNWSCNWPFLITDVKQNVKPFLHFYLSERRSSKKTKTKKGHSRKQRPFFEQQKMQFKTCSKNGSWFYCKINYRYILLRDSNSAIYFDQNLNSKNPHCFFNSLNSR